MATGFYATNTMSGSYVANKRNEEGNPIYESAAADIGIQEQAALQSLNKNYAATIENAYAQYLSSKQGVLGSAMGQGYKEAYMNAQQQALVQQIAETNATAATARQQLAESAEEARGQVQQAYLNEVANFERAGSLMDQYLTYLKGLSLTPDNEQLLETDYSGYTDEDGVIRYLTNEQSKLSLDDLYDIVYSAHPEGFMDDEGNQGLSMIEWMRNNMNLSSETDKAWWQWFNNTGKAEMEKELVQPLANKRKKETGATGQSPEGSEGSEPKDTGVKLIQDAVTNPTTVTDRATINGEKYKTDTSSSAILKNDLVTGAFTQQFNRAPTPGDIIYYQGNYYMYYRPVSGSFIGDITSPKQANWYKLTK